MNGYKAKVKVSTHAVFNDPRQLKTKNDQIDIRREEVLCWDADTSDASIDSFKKRCRLIVEQSVLAMFKDETTRSDRKNWSFDTNVEVL